MKKNYNRPAVKVQAVATEMVLLGSGSETLGKTDAQPQNDNEKNNFAKGLNIWE